MTKGITVARTTIGIDLSDLEGTYVELDEAGKVVSEGKLRLTQHGIERVMAGRQPALVAIEVGPHSPWVSRLLAELGHEVIVANARQLKLISHGQRKSDRLDAEMLARLARVDPALLRPLRHRGAQAQADLMAVRSRAALVAARTGLINSARGMAKAMGMRLPGCSAESFARKVCEEMPEVLAVALGPLLASVAELTKQIELSSRRLAKLAEEHYPETAMLRQVAGVGQLVSLTYVLTLEEHERFKKSRDVGAYLGLTARQRESGESKPQLHITKAGDRYLRSLLVQSAHYILGPFGPDSDLRRWGMKLAGSGNKTLKKRALTAVARKLSVLLHRLWATGEVYEPLRNSKSLEVAA